MTTPWPRRSLGSTRPSLFVHVVRGANLEDIELATLEWVWWFNHHRLFEPHGHIPPAEYEELYYSSQNAPVEPLTLKSNSLR